MKCVIPGPTGSAARLHLFPPLISRRLEDREGPEKAAGRAGPGQDPGQLSRAAQALAVLGWTEVCWRPRAGWKAVAWDLGARQAGRGEKRCAGVCRFSFASLPSTAGQVSKAPGAAVSYLSNGPSSLASQGQLSRAGPTQAVVRNEPATQNLESSLKTKAHRRHARGQAMGAGSEATHSIGGPASGELGCGGGWPCLGLASLQLWEHTTWGRGHPS